MSNIDISRSAWHVRLHEFIYAPDYMPRSLCPYFWQLVMGMIFILPVTPLSLPTYLYAAICNPFKKQPVRLKRLALLTRAIFGVVLMACIGIVAGAIIAIHHIIYHIATKEWQITSLILFCCAMVVMTFIVLVEAHQANRKAREDARVAAWLHSNPGKYDYEYYYSPINQKPKTDGFFILFGKAISAWYHKHCPLINWK